MRVEIAEAFDIEPWMQLAQEVAPLFGPMPEFETVLRRKIFHRQAYCVRSSGRNLLGAMLLGGSNNDFWIRWFAVFSDARRRGVGRSLVDTAILITPLDATLHVDTFAEGNPGALEADSLYRSCGFERLNYGKKTRLCARGTCGVQFPRLRSISALGALLSNPYRQERTLNPL